MELPQVVKIASLQVIQAYQSLLNDNQRSAEKGIENGTQNLQGDTKHTVWMCGNYRDHDDCLPNIWHSALRSSFRIHGTKDYDWKLMHD